MHSPMEGVRDWGFLSQAGDEYDSSKRICGETKQAEEADQTSLLAVSGKAVWLQVLLLLKLHCG